MFGLGNSFSRLGRGPGQDSSSTRITLSSSSIFEDVLIGTSVGTFGVHKGTGTYTFTLTDDAGGQFSVDATVLKTAGTFDYETTTSYTISAHADNGAGSILDRTFTIDILNVIEGGELVNQHFFGAAYFGTPYFGAAYFG